MELMIELKVNNYEEKVLKFINKYEQFFNKIIGWLEKLILALINGVEFISFIVLDGFNQLSKLMRYSTIPLHWIWIKIELWLMKKRKLEELPIFEVGAHYIYGLPAAGKSTLIYHAMMEYAYHTGKASYTTTMMETPRLNVYGREYFIHQLFSPDEFYQGGEQIVSFNTDRFNIITFEEYITINHQRNHAKKSYNDVVLPMIASMGTQRHQGIDLFYFISQLPRNDIALMQMLRGYHEMKIVKRFDYKNWLTTGKFRFKIKGWKVKSSKIEAISGSDYKKVNTKTWFYHCKYHEDMDYFNRLNMQKHYSSLRKHKGVEMS